MPQQELNPRIQRIRDIAKEMRREAEAYRKKQLQKAWERRHRLDTGDHWKDIQLEDWQAPATINHCRKTRHWASSLLTDAPARGAVVGRSEDDWEKDPNSGLSRVDRVDRMMTYLADVRSFEAKYATAINYACIYGISWMKVFFNPELKWEVTVNGELQTIPTDVDIAVFDPWYILYDPTASWADVPVSALQNAEYVHQLFDAAPV